MEKVLKNSIYIFIISLLLFNCKTDKKAPVTNKIKQTAHSVNTDTTVKYNKFREENTNCLKESDTLEIKKFREQLAKAIVKKDTLAIINFIQFTYMDKNITIKEKRQSLDYTDYKPIMELCLKEVMSEYYLGHLEGGQTFSKKKGSEGCFNYEIINNFPKLEFTHIFIFEKINGSIKLVKIETIG